MECETNAVGRIFEDAFGSFGQGTPVSDFHFCVPRFGEFD
jgi:hypothetical protein